MVPPLMEMVSPARSVFRYSRSFRSKRTTESPSRSRSPAVRRPLNVVEAEMASSPIRMVLSGRYRRSTVRSGGNRQTKENDHGLVQARIKLSDFPARPPLCGVNGGEEGIRTPGTLLGYTRFPVVHLKPDSVTSPACVADRDARAVPSGRERILRECLALRGEIGDSCTRENTAAGAPAGPFTRQFAMSLTQSRLRRYQSTSACTPLAKSVSGCQPSSRRAFEISAHVASTSAGWRSS